MKLLDDYFKLEKEIHDYFGYVEDWVKIPLNNDTEYYWAVDGNNRVVFAENKESLINLDGNHYQNEVYTQRFLPKWVYRGPEYTMICVDTRTDGNKFLSVFDNAKEVPFSELNEDSGYF